MLTAADIRKVLADVTGASFALVDGDEGLALRLTDEVVDYIPPCDKPSSFLTWLGWRFHRIHPEIPLAFRGVDLSDPAALWGT